MDDLLIHGSNPVERANYFGVLFDESPTYQELLSGTQKLAQCIKLNEVFSFEKTKLAARQGLEPQYAGPKPAVLPLDDRAKGIKKLI